MQRGIRLRAGSDDPGRPRIGWPLLTSMVVILAASGSFLRAADPLRDADYSEHAAKLRQKLPSADFHVVVQKPFVVVGDLDESDLKRWATQTVAWSVDRLKKEYFSKDPPHVLDIWLFKDEASYRKHTLQLFGDRPTTPYGYYSRRHRALIMNIATGGGTLVHEIVHPFMEANFPDCPAWFNEGLASLYEQCGDRDGRIWGQTNWRLRGLQAALQDDRVPPFATLCGTSTHEFYREDPGTNYAQARYLCYYLQQKGLLAKFYHEFRKASRQDPGGEGTLARVLETEDLEAFHGEWRQFVLQLRF